jgi:hypothetical protein
LKCAKRISNPAKSRLHWGVERAHDQGGRGPAYGDARLLPQAIELLLVWATAVTDAGLRIRLILTLANCPDDQTLRRFEELLESLVTTQAHNEAAG